MLRNAKNSWRSSGRSESAIGVGDYVIHETEMDFPKNWPIPDSVPQPITGRVWEEGAKILEQEEIVPGHLASASLIVAPVCGADPKVFAAVIGVQFRCGPPICSARLMCRP
jgi:hypothetical protein